MDPVGEQTMSEALAPATPLAASEPEVVWISTRERASRGADASLDPRSCGTSSPNLQLAQSFSAASTSIERRRLISSLLHLTGFATFAYFAIEVASGNATRLYLHEAFVPAQYRGDYVRERHDRIDPRTLAVREQRTPIVWDLNSLQRDAANQPAGIAAGDCDARAGLERFIRTMRNDEMLSGVMFDLPLPGTHVHTFASFTAPRGTRDWMQQSTIEQALTVGLAVHAFAAPHLAAAARQSSPQMPSRFEREILAGIAEGAPDKLIARRLNTTPHNVDYHLRRLRERYHAANRVELAYLSAKLGLA
jgi:DNA-binding CsgD family transcriptional regulator